MKKKITKMFKLLKTGILFFGISLLLWNCEKEDENFTNLEEPQKINNYLQKLSYEDLKFDNSFKKIAKNFKVDFLINNDDDIFKRKTADNNFTIETNKVFKIEKEDYKSFTFYINRDNTPDNTIENLIIEKRGDSVKGFFIKYEYSDQYLSDYKKNKNIPFDGNIQVSRKVEKIDELIESITKKEINHTQSKMLFCYYVNVTVDIVCQGMGIGNHTVDDLQCKLIGSSRGPRRYIESKRFCEYGDGGGLISPWSSDGYPNSTNSNSSGEVINNNDSNTTINTSCGFLGCTRTANKIASKLNLTENERLWLNGQDENFILDLETFLLENNSIEAENFAKEAFVFLKDNPLYSFSYLLNNRTPFDTINGEGEGYQEGGFDNTLYSSFNPQQLWTNISPIINKSQFVGWGHKGIRRDCMAYSKEQLKVMGFQISSYLSKGQTFQVYTAQNGVNNTQLTEGLDYLNYALSNNIPVIVGVDKVPGSSNPGTDNTTDHFVVVVGRGSDSKGNYFQFYDNASSIVNDGTNSSNKLYYNSTNGIISGNSQTGYGKGSTYTLTMIRKSKSL